MPKLTDKTYILTMKDESGETHTIERKTNWEGLSFSELIDMFKLFLLSIGFTEQMVRSIRVDDEIDFAAGWGSQDDD